MWRCMLLVLLLPSVSFALNPYDTLLYAGRYEKAVKYAEAMFPVHANAIVENNPHILLCQAYAFWGKPTEALAHCDAMENHPKYRYVTGCLKIPEDSNLYREKCLSSNTFALEMIGLPQLWERLHFAKAVAYYRKGDRERAAENLDAIKKPEVIDPALLSLVRAVVNNSNPEVPPALEQLRDDLIHGVREPSYAFLYYIFGALMLAGGGYAARRPVWHGVTASLRAMSRFIRKERPFDPRYPNTAYRYASYCNGMFFVLLAVPVITLAAILNQATQHWYTGWYV